jgi:hypothetical protein
MRNAVSLFGEQSVLEVERWISGWLGEAWRGAGLDSRDSERQLCLEVIGRAGSRASPQAVTAVAAFRRVASPDEMSLLAGTLELLAESQPLPSWSGAPPFEPVRAWRAVDIWDSEHVLFVEYGDPVPHTLMAQIMLPGGVLVEKLGLLKPGAAASWERLRAAGQVPMPVVECSVADALAELAHALRVTDMTIPRQDDDDFVDLRALALARCRPHLADWPDWQPLEDAERDKLLDDFAADAREPDDTVVRSLADLFLDYGDGYITSGPLCWSPATVELFMTDWLPRKAILDAEQRAALPDVLRRWIRFALRRRGVEPEWIIPVVEAVDTHLPEFTDAFGDTTNWGPAKQVAAELAARGIDMSDPEAVDGAVRALNAERLARYVSGDS